MQPQRVDFRSPMQDSFPNMVLRAAKNRDGPRERGTIRGGAVNTPQQGWRLFLPRLRLLTTLFYNQTRTPFFSTTYKQVSNYPSTAITHVCPPVEIRRR